MARVVTRRVKTLFFPPSGNFSPGRDVFRVESRTSPGGPGERMIWVGLDFWAGVSSAYSFFGAMVALGLGSSHPSFPLPARGSGAPQCSNTFKKHALQFKKWRREFYIH